LILLNQRLTKEKLRVLNKNLKKKLKKKNSINRAKSDNKLNIIKDDNFIKLIEPPNNYNIGDKKFNYTNNTLKITSKYYKQIQNKTWIYYECSKRRFECKGKIKYNLKEKKWFSINDCDSAINMMLYLLINFILISKKMILKITTCLIKNIKYFM
jgi:hypothetical protein